MNPQILRQMSALKDNCLAEHQSSVALYSGLIANVICPSDSGIIVISALFHDAGKIRIPDSILFKPGHLTEDEWCIMQQHPVVGAELIEKGNGKMGLDGDLEAVVLAVRHHHERWDGKGYPDGLKGGDIPLAARIIAVADAFDAMTTDRPYRKAMSREDALREIVRCAGSQFDTAIVEAFVKVVSLGG